MATLDIIIVNWNSGDFLWHCLESIDLTCKDGLSLQRVFVVDNASTDDSIDSLPALEMSLTVIRNEQNCGFAAACNQGAQGSQADYLLFLNPDVYLDPASLSVPIYFMENPQNTSIGICGIRLVDSEGQITISASRFPTPPVLLGKMSGLSRIFPQIFPPHALTRAELQQNRRVDQVMGAFFLIRRPIFEQLNGFDERFFMYFEEVDLSLRASQNGFASYYLADVSAYHKGGGTSEKVKATRLFYSLRSRTLYEFKHYSWPIGLFLTATMFLVELPMRLIVLSIIRRSFTNFSETLTGYRMLLNYFLVGGH
jgi:GT2 family glycosyltransferase